MSTDDESNPAGPEAPERRRRTRTGTRTRTGAPTTEPVDRPTLADVDHTHPHTDEAFGEAVVYRRGPVVAADGGRTGVADEPESTDDPEAVDGAGTAAVDGATNRDGGHRVEDGASEAETDPDRADDADDGRDRDRMADVDHVPPDGDEVNRVHQRGDEGRPDGR